jgi:hypothetical protein
MMKYRLTQSQWEVAIQGLNIGERTLDITRGVMVQGRPQAEFVKAFGLTRGAVSQAVQRVWRAHTAKTSPDWPEGYEHVHRRLPPHQAFLVKRWLRAATK